jgi:hypothetical protein
MPLAGNPPEQALELGADAGQIGVSAQIFDDHDGVRPQGERLAMIGKGPAASACVNLLFSPDR